MEHLTLKHLLKPTVIGLAALVVGLSIMAPTCRVRGGGTSGPVDTEFGYRVELPDRCSVVVGMGRASDSSTDYAYCITPEGGLSRFDRGAGGISYNTWAEVAFDCNRATIPLNSAVPAETAILKDCRNSK